MRADCLLCILADIKSRSGYDSSLVSGLLQDCCAFECVLLRLASNRNVTSGHKRAGVNTDSQCQRVGLTAEPCRIVQPGGLWGEANNIEGHWQVTLSHMSHKTGECRSL